MCGGVTTDRVLQGKSSMAEHGVPLLDGVWEDVLHITKLFGVSSARMGSKIGRTKQGRRIVT